MKKIKIEFKKIQEMDGHEGLAYRADLYVNGKAEGEIYDDGNGGEYMFHSYSGNYDIENTLNKLSKTDEFNEKRIYPDENDSELNRFNDLSDIYFHYGEVKFLKKYFKKSVAKIIKFNNSIGERALGLVVLSWTEGYQNYLDSFPYFVDSEVSFKRAFQNMLSKQNSLLSERLIKSKISIFPDLESIDSLLCFAIED